MSKVDRKLVYEIAEPLMATSKFPKFVEALEQADAAPMEVLIPFGRYKGRAFEICKNEDAEYFTFLGSLKKLTENPILLAKYKEVRDSGL